MRLSDLHPSTALGLYRCMLPGVMLFLAACVSAPRHHMPALLIDPGPDDHAQLVRTVSRALNVSTVVLADDALTRESMFFIERTPARNEAGRRLDGRDVAHPEQFQLVTDGHRCGLIHRRSGKLYALPRLRCRPSLDDRN